MASIVALPFNFQPLQTLFTSYHTLAAGTYVYAVPLSPACTVDGARVFELGTFPSPANSVDTLRTIAPNNFTGRIFTNSTNTNKTLTCQGVVVTSTGTNILDVTLLDGSVVGVASGLVGLTAGATQSNIQYISGVGTTVTLAPASIHPVWLSNLEVLSGDNWVIHVFNKLT